MKALRGIRCLNWDREIYELRYDVNEGDLFGETGRDRLREKKYANYDEKATGEGSRSVMVSRARWIGEGHRKI